MVIPIGVAIGQPRSRGFPVEGGIQAGPSGVGDDVLQRKKTAHPQLGWAAIVWNDLRWGWAPFGFLQNLDPVIPMAVYQIKKPACHRRRCSHPLLPTLDRLDRCSQNLGEHRLAYFQVTPDVSDVLRFVCSRFQIQFHGPHRVLLLDRLTALQGFTEFGQVLDNFFSEALIAACFINHLGSPYHALGS